MNQNTALMGIVVFEYIILRSNGCVKFEFNLKTLYVGTKNDSN